MEPLLQMHLQMSCNNIEYPYPHLMDARSPGLPPDSLPKVVASPALDGSGWRTARGEPSLAGMFASVKTAKQGSFWRKLLAFLGPGYLVAVGYMDPGNWATSLAGGSKFGYALLA
jgi:manganese transport protein